MLPLRILLLADSHLGIDLPARPRVARRRRGEDFFANYERALGVARRGAVDLVVHGGDVFDGPDPSADLARRALRPLLEVADRGVPVFVVPGNHERARVPAIFAVHSGIHVFDRPRTYVTEVHGVRVALAGFPYERQVRTRFADLVDRTGWREAAGHVTVLCMHHCVEGARVGPGDFTFTSAPDVIRGRDIPRAFAAVLSGHIHRGQVLTEDLRGRPLGAPVLYPGSVERTSTAEIGESKGYVAVEIGAAGVRWRVEPLPARPMLVRTLELGGLDARAVERAIVNILAETPPDAVLQLRVTGEVGADARRVLAAPYLRALAPATMNIQLSEPGRFRRGVAARRRPRAVASPQIELGLLGNCQAQGSRIGIV